jgi:hypothetical protein
VSEPTYDVQTWHDLPATDTEINAARLTHVEDGLGAATQRAAVSVRYDVAQALSADAKAQARANLGVGTAAVTVNGVAADGGGDVQLTAADVGASPDLGYAVLEAFGLSPANSAAANDDAIVAALATGKPLRCGPGFFDFAAHHDFGTQGLVGAGGQVAHPLTVFRAQNAAAQVELSGGGAACGGFQVDGNLTATTPFKRSGGTGANGRTFFDITVKSTTRSQAPTPTTSPCSTARRTTSGTQCGFYLADRDGMSFDQGYGGATFQRCEQAGEGRDGLHFDNLVAGGPYPVPSNLEFTGTSIGEYNGAGRRRPHRGRLPHQLQRLLVLQPEPAHRPDRRRRVRAGDQPDQLLHPADRLDAERRVAGRRRARHQRRVDQRQAAHPQHRPAVRRGRRALAHRPQRGRTSS